jgi:hypothetical protein
MTAVQDLKQKTYIVVHPLDDIPETKVDVTGLGPMKLTLGGKISLIVLRCYLIGIILLVFFNVIQRALHL